VSGSGLFAPIAAALALVPRWQSAVSWAVIVAMASTVRATVLSMSDPSSVGVASLALGLASALILAALTFFLARTFLAPQTAHARPLYLRTIGLFALMYFLQMFVSLAGTVVVFANDPSPFMMTYGSVLVGSLGEIVVFPILVRVMTASAGAEEPRLAATLAFVLAHGRYAYLWYVICAAVFSSLMVFTFANLLGPGNQANALAGNVLQSAITGTGDLLQLLLAIVVARWAIPGWQSQAAVFD
jgi:hypothetical protein